MMQALDNLRIAVVGLGYVGLPLAVEFGKQYEVVGFDIDSERIEQLRAGVDVTQELPAFELAAADKLHYTTDLDVLRDCKVFIVAVPTPVDKAKRPDLEPLLTASLRLGKVLKRGDLVIYESTVYPGCTEEICIPQLERGSGLKLNVDFFVGYSPERINPGDRKHRLQDICKLTSGSTPEAADVVDRLYARIVTAGTHKTRSIKVAEAAKIIENTQRDLNIAFINDLAIFFNRLGIDTQEVLAAAATKWNFQAFQPGLVGGHCTGVDPYYLAYKAQATGHHLDLILAARKINESMGAYIAGEVIRLMLLKGINPLHARVLLLGLSFKENCPDLRNTRVVDMVQALRAYTMEVDIYDPWVDAASAVREVAIELVSRPCRACYDAVILAVGHRQFVALGGEGIRAFGKAKTVVYDIKSVLPREAVDGRL